VKAFAAVGGLPVAGVPTLHAVAAAGGVSECTVAAIAAGRGEIFAQLLRVAADGAVEELSPAAHVKPASLVEQVLQFSGAARWIGGGATAHRELIGQTAERAGLHWREMSQREAGASPPARAGWSLVAPVESYAEQVAKLGLISFEKGLTVRAETLQALYVRPSDAELKERCHA
jgi:tRNA A37 threonylcarbamoyladenosine modification protein TsaB